VTTAPDPDRDVLPERILDLPRDLVWGAWTTPGAFRTARRMRMPKAVLYAPSRDDEFHSPAPS
jgi:hypothetical protein